MSRGFSLLELLIATAISALLAAAIAAVVPPLQAFFERTPAQIDLQQRARTAIDTIAQAVRGADRVVLMDETADPGQFRQLMTVAPAVNAARATVAYDQLGAGGDLFLAAAPCPSAPEVCGFARGSSAMIAGVGGAFDVFTVGSVDAGTRSLSPRRSFSQPYKADASIVEVDAYTFRLDPQPDGSLTLVRQTAGGAVQPIADRVSEVRFAHVFEGRGVDVELQLRTLGSTASTITRRIAIVARNVR